MATLPGCDLLGSGYDILNGYYADARSCRSNLFDLASDKLETVLAGTRSFTKPKTIVYHWVDKTVESVSSGEDIEEYTRSINSKTKLEGDYNFFSGSVEADIGISNAGSSQNSFSKFDYTVHMFTLQLPPHHSDWLKPVAKQDIDSMDLTDLFNSYGTHYLAGLVMGGIANYAASTNKTSFQSSYDISLVVKMSYKALVGSISSQEELQYKEDIKSFSESSSVKVQTSGGDPATGGESLPQHMQDWLSSIMDYMSFVDFEESGSLIGIWELASTPERAQQIQDFYPQYCEAMQRQYKQGPYLRVKIVPLTRQQFTDTGSHAAMYLTVCAPDVGGGWYYLGQVALPGGGPSGDTLVVQEIEEGSGALADISSWERVWDDSGSHNGSDYSLWRGIPANPVEYIAVSDFFRGGVDHNDPPAPPPANETSGLKAVRVDCLVEASVGKEVWMDEGSHASEDGSVWEIVPGKDDTISGGNIKHYFVSNGSWNSPTRSVYALKKSAVILEE